MVVSLRLFALHIYGCKQGCSGAGTHGNGVPTPFSRFTKTSLKLLYNG